MGDQPGELRFRRSKVRWNIVTRQARFTRKKYTQPSRGELFSKANAAKPYLC